MKNRESSVLFCSLNGQRCWHGRRRPPSWRLTLRTMFSTTSMSRTQPSWRLLLLRCLTGPAAPFGGRSRSLTLSQLMATRQRLYAGRSMPLMSTTNVTPGQAIADIGSFGLNDIHLVILQPDGTRSGVCSDLALAARRHRLAHRQARQFTTWQLPVEPGRSWGRAVNGPTNRLSAGPLGPSPWLKTLSNRRAHGGNSRRDIIHLIPMAWPEVWTLPAGPAIFHSADFSLVTTEKPARVGELLIMGLKGLGPVKGKLNPGQPFPSGDLMEVIRRSTSR